MASETVTKNDLTAILNEVLLNGSNISNGGNGTSSSVPTANIGAKFDTEAQLNSTDMTSQEIDSFINSLTVEKTNLLDFFYPIGSYYETSNTTFDPNISWGGTWELETQGKVHVSAGSDYTVGSSYGNNTHVHTTGNHTLTVNEMPSHSHEMPLYYGSGFFASGGEGGWIQVATYKNTMASGGGAAHNHGNTGSSALNSWQPSIAVNRWHRTA